MIWLPSRYSSRSAELLSEEHLEWVYFAGLQALRNIFTRGAELSRDAKMFYKTPGWLLAYVGTANIELGVRFNRDPDSGYFMASRHFLRMGVSVASEPPEWLGNKAFHLAQCSHLIRVDPAYYAHRLPLNTPLELPLIWPKGV